MSQAQQSFVRWDPPDTIFMRLVGRVDGDEMKRLNELVIEYGTGKPLIFMLIDLSHTSSLTAEARRFAPEPAKRMQAGGVAFFGASYHIRVISGLVARAATLLGKQRDQPIRFFATEAEARAWLAERRASLSSAVTK